MIWRRLATIPARIWWLLAAVTMYIFIIAVVRITRVVSPTLFLYAVQPILALLLAAVAYKTLGGKKDRVRHKTEKSLVIMSVIAIWFVLYFLSGMVLTFVHNAVAMSLKTVALNIVSFGIAAAALEYVRYSLMQTSGRRNLLWFGAIISLIFAFEQLSFNRIGNLDTTIDVMKFLVSDVLPALGTSALLTYLAFSAGFGPQLTYRLGVLATVIVPPIIPKYDWYLVGTSSILLAVAVYIVIDRTRRDLPIQGRRYKHTKRAYDVMFLATLAGLVMFMLGVFAYKPMAIVSNSMKPVFSRGSLVIVQKANAMDVRQGDIVQYEAPGHMVTHRVQKIEQSADGGERVFTTKGDNSPSADVPVRAKQIVGIVRAQVPYVGYPSVWLNEMTASKKG